MMNAQPSPIPRSNAHRQRRARRGIWRKLLWVVIVLGGLAALVAGLWPKPVPVETQTVGRGPLTVSVLEEGKTRIRHRYGISSPVAGYLRRVALRAGAPIEAGKTTLAAIVAQPSSLLDPRSIVEAEARINTAMAIRDQRQSEVNRARTALDLAQKEFDRLNPLRQSGVISRQEWDEAENRVQALTRELNTAEFALRVAAFEIEQAQAALLQTQSADPAGSATIQILAPVDGFVLKVDEESARIVAPGTPIMEVGDPRDLEAEIELLSSDAVMVQPGADVSIEQWGGGEPLRGRVALVERGGFTKYSALGVEEQRVLVRVDFIDPLPPGTVLGDRYHVEARIVVWHGEDVIQVPTGALFRHGGEWMTYVAEEGLARRRTLQIDHNNGIMAEVLSGLTPGESVIMHPPDTLTDGVPVAPES